MAALIGGSQQRGPSTQLTVTLIGGGNATHCLAPLVVAAGFPLNILTRSPEAWNEEVEVVNEDLGWLRVTSIKAKPDLITSDPGACIPQSDIILFAGVPIHHNSSLLQTIKPHLDPTRHVFIGSICCYGGFNWVVKNTIGLGNCTIYLVRNLFPGVVAQSNLALQESSLELNGCSVLLPVVATIGLG